MYLRLNLHQEIHLWYCKPGQKPVAVEAISASREAAATVLLVDMLCLPNYLLNTYFSAQRVVLLPAVVSRGSSAGENGKSVSLPPMFLREHPQHKKIRQSHQVEWSVAELSRLAVTWLWHSFMPKIESSAFIRGRRATPPSVSDI